MRKIVSVMMAFALALAMPVLAFAAGGNGSGGGNGGGSANPLEVTSTSVEMGGSIAAGDSITLVFSKNVCEASVRDANKALASVKDAQGNDVPVNVVLADDQVEPSKKNDMVVEFVQAPAEGAYTLTAKAGITAKSGDALAQDFVLEFNVAAQGASGSAAAVAASASAPATSASAPAASASSSSSAASSAASGQAQQGGMDPMPFIVIGIIVIAAGFGGVMLAKNKK